MNDTENEELKRIFSQIDSDHDGTITYTELVNNTPFFGFLSATTKFQSARDFLMQYDRNLDGSLSFTELKEMIQEASNLD